jgi:hypothetical protein
MSLVTRRFLYKGPWPVDLKSATDPGLTIPAPGFYVTYDITFDDAVCDAATMDERMRHWGCFPDTQDTIVLSPAPFLGIKSPDGSAWKISIDNLGVMTTSKVSA